MNPRIHYPSAFHQKVLAMEAPGGAPAELRLVIPSITKPGQAFDAKVAVLDERGYLSLRCNDPVRIESPGQDPIEVAFRPGLPASAWLKDIRLRDEGVFRFSARRGNMQTRSNPTLCSSEDLPGIFWGDPHVHTILSNCHADKSRSLNFCFTAARHLSMLDWVSAADHVSNGRCDFSKWKEQSTVANLYDDPPDFVTLPAYEASLQGGAGGDNNVYMRRFPAMFADAYEDGSVKTLCEKLSDLLPPEDFFVVPHHTTRTGKHGEIPDEIYPGADAMPLVEIHSKWGTSEYRGNPNPLKKIHPGPSYVEDFLARGFKLGFIAGTDSHATMPSGGGDEPGHIDRLPGLTAVAGPDCSRRSIFESLRKRHCYAASRERILLHGSIAGCRFGEAVSPRNLPARPAIDLLVAAETDIQKIELIRNGDMIHSVSPNSWRSGFTYEDHENPADHTIDSKHSNRLVYYYVRITCVSGAQAWSSPVWITT